MPLREWAGKDFAGAPEGGVTAASGSRLAWRREGPVISSGRLRRGEIAYYEVATGARFPCVKGTMLGVVRTVRWKLVASGKI